MEIRSDRARSKLTLFVAMMALIVAFAAFIQGGADKARAALTFDEKVAQAINDIRMVVASSAKQCTQYV